MVPGQRISQRELADLFSTSTIPVREAFQVLVAQGFVRIDRNRDAVVACPSPEQIREINEIRKALESLAVIEAIPNLGQTDLDHFQLHNQQMGRLTVALSGWS